MSISLRQLSLTFGSSMFPKDQSPACLQKSALPSKCFPSSTTSSSVGLSGISGGILWSSALQKGHKRSPLNSAYSKSAGNNDFFVSTPFSCVKGAQRERQIAEKEAPCV